MKKSILLFTIAAMMLNSCVLAVLNRQKLTEEDVVNYISVYTELRENAPEILENINKDPKNADIGIEEYDKIKQIIKDGGFNNLADFVYVNAKIGTIFGLIQAQRGMETFDSLHVNSSEAIEQSIEEIQKIIDDPTTPNDTKVQLQQQIEELKQNQQVLDDKNITNDKWAQLVLNSTKKIGGLIVSEKDIELVTKYEEEIKEAYTGFQEPVLLDGSFPDIDLEDYQ